MKVNLTPFFLDTPWWGFLADAQKAAVFAEYAAKTPVGRVGQPQDVAQAIALLVSNGFVSGQVLVCDGGLRLGC